MNQVPAELVAVFRDLATGKSPWPLLLYGETGVGKTYAALSFCDIVQPSQFWTVDAICDRTIRKDDYPDKSAMRDQLVVVDELGERRTNDLIYGALKKFLDLREYHRGRATICISNLDPEDLARVFDDRITSRLLAGTVFHLAGPDRRLAQRTLF